MQKNIVKAKGVSHFYSPINVFDAFFLACYRLHLAFRYRESKASDFTKPLEETFSDPERIHKRDL